MFDGLRTRPASSPFSFLYAADRLLRRAAESAFGPMYEWRLSRWLIRRRGGNPDDYKARCEAQVAVSFEDDRAGYIVYCERSKGHEGAHLSGSLKWGEPETIGV